MEYEEDFVKDDIVEFKIEGRVFGYKPATAGEETSWLQEYLIIDGDNTRQDFERLNKCKLRNLKKVPYDKELVFKLIGVNKEWQHLTHDEKWKLLSKLKPWLFNKIINNINKIDTPVKKKDS